MGRSTLCKEILTDEEQLVAILLVLLEDRDFMKQKNINKILLFSFFIV